MQIRTIGELTCRLIGTTEAPQAVVVFCHGFGAGGDDLVPLAGELMQLDSKLREGALFVFPEAPLAIPELQGGRAWWPIDLLALQAAAERGEFREMRQEAPELFPEARTRLIAILDQLREETHLPLSQFALGGFSQGSMLATDVALRLEEQVGGLVIYSGTLLVEAEWRELAPRRRGLAVFQSHGTIDSLLPFEAAGWLRDLLIDAGADVEFLQFPGMHTIPREALARTASLLSRTLMSPGSESGEATDAD